MTSHPRLSQHQAPVPSSAAAWPAPELPVPEVQRARRSDRESGVVWDLRDLTMFAQGKLADVFGEPYAVVDSYRRRVRLPTAPYLLVTRVVRIDAQRDAFRKSRIVTEYDIPHGAWYSAAGQVPWAIAVESGQCDLLLISYLGIDFANKGERVYRLLDCELTFVDKLPEEGDTLRFEIVIDSFVRNGQTLLFFFHYDCFIRDRLVLTMRNGAAGFFTDDELAAGRGVVRTALEERARASQPSVSFQPWLSCAKHAFDRQDIDQLCAGDLHGCFGRARDPEHPHPQLAFGSAAMRMIDEVCEVDPRGGPSGLGRVVARKALAPDDWYFPCHFKDDPVLAGSLLAEGCSQLLRFYGLFVGMHSAVSSARFQPLPGQPQRVRCRGQVQPQYGVLEYRMEITELGREPYPYVKADVDIVLNGKVVVRFSNLGLCIEDLSPMTTQLPSGAVREAESPWPIHMPALPREHPVARVPAYVEGAYPARRPPFRPFPGNPADLNCVPDTLPFTWYHFSEFATGRIAHVFGDGYACYDARVPPRTPNSDLQLVSRVVEIAGERHDLKGKAQCVAEFDCPADAWWFQHGSHPAFLPYSMLMEIALQPCGFLSAWLGTTLRIPDADLSFRNLDGEARVHAALDVRGKTIRNRSTLLSTTCMGSTIIQTFEFELSVLDVVLYSGRTVFGYFDKAALANQVGLDKGRRIAAWHRSSPAAQAPERKRVREPAVRTALAPRRGPHYALGRDRLNLIDYAEVVPGGGRYGAGYVYGERDIDAQDWFFPCHFHQDPVMPGSLGLEAMLELLQVYALWLDLGASLHSPRFDHALDQTRWKYRGQITPADARINVELHVRAIEHTPQGLVLRADAELSKDGLRIYTVTGLGLALVSART